MWKIKSFCLGQKRMTGFKNLTRTCVLLSFVTFLAYIVLMRTTFHVANVRTFQSNIEVEFPYNSDKPIRIPHIIHQIYNTPRIPKRYTNLVKSFHEKNPTWKYMFWTYDSGRNLIKEKHPYILKVFDGFGNSVKKADMLRYVLLYEYGGFYADLDVINLRPLDNVTRTYACMLPTEPIEHVALLYKVPFILLNGIMLCRPKHPFFERVLWNLRAANVSGEPIRTTGPLYLTKQYMLYNELTVVDILENDHKIEIDQNSPYFYKGGRSDTDDDNVFIPNSQYFIDSLDPNVAKRMKHLCKKQLLRYDTEIRQMACAEYIARMSVRKNKRYAYTDHIWDHLWGKTPAEFKKMSYVHILELIPTVLLYNATKVTL